MSTDTPSPAKLLDTTRLAEELEQFAEARNWAQFHSPKNLAMALAGETGELVEIFQWMTEEQSKTAAHQPETARAVRDELADVLMYVVRLADRLGVDLNEAVHYKLQLNGQKYPVDKARNTSKKYDQL